jgi:hypothetical protein
VCFLIINIKRNGKKTGKIKLKNAFSWGGGFFLSKQNENFNCGTIL